MKVTVFRYGILYLVFQMRFSDTSIKSKLNVSRY